MEPFANTMDEVVFSESVGIHAASKDRPIGCSDWNITNLTDTLYSSTDEFGEEYTHLTFSIHAERLSSYYVWQLMFPLLIIILASCVIFWVHEYSLSVEIGFTLMLTVVAYNFYSESLLPKLPYNTFIEVIIMIGYVVILLSIIATVYNNHLFEVNHERGIKLRNIFKIIYPIGLIISISIVTLYYFLQ